VNRIICERATSKRLLRFGAFMTLQLRDADRRAVDLLLDRAATGTGVNPNGAGNGNGHHGASFSQVSGDVQTRLPAAQKVLQMLDMLPAEEPPQDLLARTLRQLDAARANHRRRSGRPSRSSAPRCTSRTRNGS
jgi:hypothetical protein